MSTGFPLYTNLGGNNCTVFGGGPAAARRVRELLRFDAKVTVISPSLCSELQVLSREGKIRHIPRKYFRGDCSSAQLCVAATGESSVNIAIAVECKAKQIPVNVTSPKIYGTFRFPRVIVQDDVTVAVDGFLPSGALDRLQALLQEALPDMLRQATDRTTQT